ncbi:MAG: SIMPL domain-containing protein [Bacteroidota bacterium]|jgi:uncharacterized protein YggE|nr:SIMPL domain-containing protein [Bacteroidota bacterium]
MKKLKLLCLFICFFFLSKAQNKNFIDQPYIEVSGSADSLVTPDEIFIKIIVSEKDTRNRISVEEQESKMIRALESLGIDVEKDLTTKDIGSNFKFHILRGKDVIKSKQYILKVTDAVTATNVFLKLEELEISNSSIDRVNYSDLENLKTIMRTRAVEDAKRKAISLVRPLNQNVGSAIHITDAENVSMNITNRYQNDLQEVVVVGYSAKFGQKEQPLKIEFQKIKVTGLVNVKFILK